MVTHKIITDDHSPIVRAPYRIPNALREETKNQIQVMLKEDIIRPSVSPWSAPVVLVEKKSPVSENQSPGNTPVISVIERRVGIFNR